MTKQDQATQLANCIRLLRGNPLDSRMRAIADALESLSSPPPSSPVVRCDCCGCYPAGGKDGSPCPFRDCLGVLRVGKPSDTVEGAGEALPSFGVNTVYRLHVSGGAHTRKATDADLAAVLAAMPEEQRNRLTEPHRSRAFRVACRMRDEAEREVARLRGFLDDFVEALGVPEELLAQEESHPVVVAWLRERRGSAEAAEERAAKAESALEELSDRITTIADESCGLQPVQPADESLTLIERKLFELRRELEAARARVGELARVVDRLHTLARDAVFEVKNQGNTYSERFGEKPRVQVRYWCRSCDDVVTVHEGGCCARCGSYETERQVRVVDPSKRVFRWESPPRIIPGIEAIAASLPTDPEDEAVVDAMMAKRVVKARRMGDSGGETTTGAAERATGKPPSKETGAESAAPRGLTPAEAEEGRWLFENIPWNKCAEPAGEWKDALPEERAAWAAVERKAHSDGARSEKAKGALLEKRIDVLRAAVSCLGMGSLTRESDARRYLSNDDDLAATLEKTK